MADDIPLSLQTAYADLVERCAAAAFDEAFPEEGTFIAKTVRGNRYWYFQVPTAEGRGQRYVGPETPELMERIGQHKMARHDIRDREKVISALVRSRQFPQPLQKMGEILSALARAGVFRLRGVLVGTVAYHTYSAMLGVRFPASSASALQTIDVDVAQFSEISVAIQDRTPKILDVLREVDESFRPIPNLRNPTQATQYIASSGVRVDFLTPGRRENTDRPKSLPALGTDAQQLHFLDFLIYQPVPAAILYGAGVYVQVPSPERYTIHKLIVSRRRNVGSGKGKKDIQQAESLLDALVRKRPRELRAAWREAFGRRGKWPNLLGEGLGAIDPNIRDQALRAVDASRDVISGLALRFAAPAARYDFDRDVVTFLGEAGGSPVRCAISREALEDHFGADGLDKVGRLEKFRENRETIEAMLQKKYLSWPVEDVGAVLIKSADLPRLRRQIAQKGDRRQAR